MGDETQTNALLKLTGDVGKVIGGVEAIQKTQTIHGKKIDKLRTEMDTLNQSSSSDKIKAPSIIPARFNGRTGAIMSMLKVLTPYIIFGLIALGVYIGTGGDTNKTQEIMQRLEEKVDEVSQNIEYDVRADINEDDRGGR